MEVMNGSSSYESYAHLEASPASNSASPGSVSNRSSNSSLNNVGAHGHLSSKQKSVKKVSIVEKPSCVLKRDKSNLTASSVATSHRTSLIKVQGERQARKVRFFINGDKFFKGAIIPVSSEKFRTFDKLLEHLSRIMCNQVTLPNGVRFIFNFEGKILECLEDLGHGGNYLCSSVNVFKKMEYLKIVRDNQEHNWNRIMKRETYYIGLSQIKLKRDIYKLSGHSKSFGQSNKSLNENGEKSLLKPKIIAVLRSGLKPRRAVRVLLNSRNTKSFDNILSDLTNTVKLDSGAVRKIFTLCGKPVVNVQDFNESEVFIAYGVDKCDKEDFDLDVNEFRGVQAILKSSDLDAKYAKFSAASSSPKTSRKKFLHSRLPVKTAQVRKSKSSSRTPEPRSEVEVKYELGDVIGGGNFAVVKRVKSRKNGKTFALKVIDKAKCQGKEHMIDSEVTILNVVCHEHIIELIEVFDTPEERFLVTEFVPGGDLFDAITLDTKYSEPQARNMIQDLASALKYLHDKMIVHRDIKPENLLVFERKDGAKSLKLGDFGLAQAVHEPLFIVCGTPTYVAPEILAETGYGVKVDIWATGVIMYILLCGFPPFSSRTNNQEEVFDQILSGLFEFNAPDWNDISFPAKELISWMLQVDPLQRYSAYEILDHRWMAHRV
eukprot:TRINITY_DN3055_c1_g1_i1.p1 TRINITY_DN3055_c1_g1~~TRINITY_DN3055_c1_g1_i1.p1  ORF type:complete len:660 (-),score=257.16 TRINITY_DN3055_c1_g1_i1:330-2309(-)